MPVRVSILASAAELEEAVAELLRGGSVTLGLAWQRAEPVRPGGPRSRRRYAQRLPVTKGRGVVRYIDVSDIDWIEAANQYVRLHAGGGTSLLRDSMERLTKLLDPERFLRVHRSAIVNLDRVREVWVESPTVHWAVLESGARLPVSRSRRDELQTALLGID